MSYDEGIYGEIAPFWGDRLWAFLAETGTMVRMLKGASEGRSPVESIADDLTQRFGFAVREKRVRDFTGYLAWQALERHLVEAGGDNSRAREIGSQPVHFRVTR